jgi:hypothetical protein
MVKIKNHAICCIICASMVGGMSYETRSGPASSSIDGKQKQCSPAQMKHKTLYEMADTNRKV